MEYQKISEAVSEPFSENLKKLQELFPSVVKDGDVDFEALKAELGEFTEVGKERYELDWAGKQDAQLLTGEPLIGKTLKYVAEESKNPETTENLYIEGDNLEALKLLQNSYRGKIKMIYIDPPYNTGEDFIYQDRRFQTQAESDIAEGARSEDGERLIVNSKSSAKYHANWLSMMYPRLRLARDFLREDGVIFISIDDDEVGNLRIICDEIFGAHNFITELIWSAGRKNDSKHISISHQYVLCYFKNIQYIKDNKLIWREKKQGLDNIYAEYNRLKKIYGDDCKGIEKELRAWYKNLPDGTPAKDHKHYKYVDDKGIFFASDISWPGGGGPKYTILHPTTKKPVQIPSRGWITNEATMMDWISNGKVMFGDDETKVPTIKSYLKENEYSVPYSVFYKDGRAASKRLAQLMGDKVFENPKDEEILQRIIQFSGTDDGDIVLDFFSGTGTTAHATFLTNVELGIKINFILVQLPEIINPDNAKSQKSKKVMENAIKLLESLNRPHNISEIGKERIRRAGEMIKAEHPEVDVGFKVFKVDDTNIRWLAAEAGKQGITLEDALSAGGKDLRDFMNGTNDLDVVYEILIRQYGIPLTAPIDLLSDIGERTYSIADTVVVCLEEEVTDSVIDKIANLEPIPQKIVFRDSAFGDNISLKENAMLRLDALMQKHAVGGRQPYSVEFL